jgi:hypothetical protein
MVQKSIISIAIFLPKVNDFVGFYKQLKSQDNLIIMKSPYMGRWALHCNLFLELPTIIGSPGATRPWGQTFKIQLTINEIHWVQLYFLSVHFPASVISFLFM